MVMDEIMHNPSNKNSAPCLNREIESRWWLVGETPTIHNIASIVSCELCCILIRNERLDWNSFHNKSTLRFLWFYFFVMKRTPERILLYSTLMWE